MSIEEEILKLEERIQGLKSRISAHSPKIKMVQELEEPEDELPRKKREKFLFKGYSIVSCATLHRELNYLKDAGFLDADRILYTIPGLHENPLRLRAELKRQLNNAKRNSGKIIVVYGSGCYIDTRDPFFGIDALLKEEGGEIKRIRVKNCIDALCSIEEREKIAQGKKVYWLSPGWLEYWKQIFKDWDIGKANETFPQNDKAILLDGVDFFDEYSRRYPERVLEFSDWMRLSIEPYKISLERVKKLLLDVIAPIEERG
ncbi:MAG: hypothetical protein DRP61_02990 [Candidatus Omnitrophota bacterium]|nr:MAG: hypothetical protein DRP61_02990 [Candidatus Omnitrophota bacterium]RKY42641.1 MAG: hypothetical protein DRP80_06565 [Candidatus Omnitrophota bacterium]